MLLNWPWLTYFDVAFGSDGAIVLWSVMLGLAAWRISSMLVYEYGPFGLFKWMRAKTGIIHDPDTCEVVAARTQNVLSCVWCTSVWVIFVLVFMPVILVAVIAIMAIPCLIELARHSPLVEK